MKRLTKKEEIIMEHFWEKDPLYVVFVLRYIQNSL